MISSSRSVTLSTTSTDYWKSITDLFFTTSANYFVASSSTVPKTYTNNTFSNTNAFNAGITSYVSTTIGDGSAIGGLTINGTATTTSLIFTGLQNSLLKVNGLGAVVAAPGWYPLCSVCISIYADYFWRIAGKCYPSTLIGFTQGIYSLASSTIGSGSQAGGLYISGGATTTGNAIVGGTLAVGTSSPFAALHVQHSTNSTSFPGLVINNVFGGSNSVAQALISANTANASMAGVGNSGLDD